MDFVPNDAYIIILYAEIPILVITIEYSVIKLTPIYKKKAVIKRQNPHKIFFVVFH